MASGGPIKPTRRLDRMAALGTPRFRAEARDPKLRVHVFAAVGEHQARLAEIAAANARTQRRRPGYSSFSASVHSSSLSRYSSSSCSRSAAREEILFRLDVAKGLCVFFRDARPFDLGFHEPVRHEDVLPGFERKDNPGAAVAQVVAPELQLFKKIVIEHARFAARDLAANFGGVDRR